MFQVLTKPTVIIALLFSRYYFICTDLKKNIYIQCVFPFIFVLEIFISKTIFLVKQELYDCQF